MKITSAEFIKSAKTPSEYPESGLPEIAFAGRSNVGKSSLINILVNRKRLVKTSATPGRTRLLNFFLINRSMVFVDLPGYGYAKVPVAIRKSWGPMIETYLSTRPALKGVVLIMDIRRDPGEDERNFLSWLHGQGLGTIPVLTKSDKLSPNKQAARVKAIQSALLPAGDELIRFSARTRQGKDRVWAALSRMLGRTPPDENLYDGTHPDYSKRSL